MEHFLQLIRSKHNWRCKSNKNASFIVILLLFSVRSTLSFKMITSSKKINFLQQFYLVQLEINTFSLPFFAHGFVVLFCFLSIKFPFISRQNAEYQEALGQTLHNVIKNIPGGVLVFFPCYKMIEEVVTTWKVCFILICSTVVFLSSSMFIRLKTNSEQRDIRNHESTKTCDDRTTK